MMKKIFSLALLLALSLPAWGDVILTNPVNQPSVLGGPGTVPYDTVPVVSYTVDPVANSITAAVELTASSDPNRPALRGTYSVSTVLPQAALVMPTLGFDQSLSLTPTQVASVQASIASFTGKLDDSMVALGLVAGTVQ